LTQTQAGTQGKHIMRLPWSLHVHTATTASQSRQGVAPTLAFTGLVCWLVQTYLVHPIPAQVSAAIYTLTPATIGWLVSHVTISKVTL
jgi:hypothetical protein